MTTTDEDTTRAIDNIETFLRMVTLAKSQRDPCRWLHDQLLDLREAVKS